MLTKRSSTALMRVPVCGPKISSHLRGRRSVAHCPFLEYRKPHPTILGTRAGVVECWKYAGPAETLFDKVVDTSLAAVLERHGVLLL
jgi:hypothetical protein